MKEHRQEAGSRPPVDEETSGGGTIHASPAPARARPRRSGVDAQPSLATKPARPMGVELLVGERAKGRSRGRDGLVVGVRVRVRVRRGRWIVDRGSSIVDHRSWIVDREPRVVVGRLAGGVVRSPARTAGRVDHGFVRQRPCVQEMDRKRRARAASPEQGARAVRSTGRPGATRPQARAGPVGREGPRAPAASRAAATPAGLATRPRMVRPRDRAARAA
jgi:hypothetical protein